MVRQGVSTTGAPCAPPIGRAELVSVALILGLGLAVRGLMLLVLHQPAMSDSLSYIRMAQAVIEGRRMEDIYGNRALYSPGYPFALAIPFALFGASVTVARVTNLVLGGISILLLWWLARRVTGRPLVALLAAVGLALLIPAAVGVEAVERENLSVPLLLAHVLVCVAMLDTRRPALCALIGGCVFACGLYAGASAAFTGACFLCALAWRRGGWLSSARWLIAFGIAAALTVAPYLARNARAVGAPVFSTNGGINLYIGNNPRANGYFRSVAELPVGPGWEAMRRTYGELGQDRRLRRMAIDYAVTHPWRTISLDLRKLLYFWLPDLPDRGDEYHGVLAEAARWAAVVQHVLIIGLALIAVGGWRRWAPAMWIVLLAILAFWAIHGIFYMITRYREPAMPLMILLAALPVADLVGRLVRGRAPALGRLTASPARRRTLVALPDGE